MNVYNKLNVGLTRIFVFLFLFSFSCKKHEEQKNYIETEPLINTIRDIDGNVYHTVKIGNQVWMVENLRTTSFRNGEPITLVLNNNQWANIYAGAYCYYGNDTSNIRLYGNLYNWTAINDSRKLAPVGWHVASAYDWNKLAKFLDSEVSDTISIGGYNSLIAGGKLKVVGTNNWNIPNTGATNEIGFTALPGGYRTADGLYTGIKVSGCWWTSSEFPFINGSSDAINQVLFYNNTYIGTYNSSYYTGYAVRCVKD